MSPRPSTLVAIQRSFAGRDQLVARALRENRSFRKLCEHYLQCLAALNHWRELQAPEAAVRQQEYAELREELAREIEAWLEAMEAGSPRTNRVPA